MLDCIIYGWDPPIQRSEVRPRDNLRNSKNATAYAGQLKKELDTMISNGVVETVGPSEITRINPIGAVVKNSDKQRARSLVGIDVTDSVSLQRASDALVAIGQPKIKCRMSTDCTGSGLNGAAYSPSFAYSTISDAVRLVSRGGYMAKGDISRYFYTFPLARRARDLFGFYLFGQYWRFNNLPFGLTNCPYYCSTWTAEFSEWATAMGIPNTFMVDDIFLHNLVRAIAQADLERFAAMLKDVGFGMEEAKFGIGQQLTFIGILLDTVSMTLRMDPLSAGGYVLQLNEYTATLQAPNGSLNLSELNHLAGKLNWFSEVIQGGRLHIRAIWQYLQICPKLSAELRVAVLIEIHWWTEALLLWSDGSDHRGQFPILSGPELLANPDHIELCQSDASGTDGFGYVHSLLASAKFEWTSVRWVQLPKQSHHAELLALHHFVLQRRRVGITLLIWITDSESACYSINRANCSDPQAYPLVVAIYEECERTGCQLLAVWVPRELNNLADHLSHLAFVLCRHEVHGTSSISVAPADPGQAQG
jgi:hypothetical protein